MAKEITEETIDDLVSDIEDIIEPSKNRDELWLKFLVPLSFEALEYNEKDFTDEDKISNKLLRDCYFKQQPDQQKLKIVSEKIFEYKNKDEEVDFNNKKHRYLLSSMKSLSYYPITQKDWDNGLLWIIVSDWIESGVPLKWIYDKLQNIKDLLLKLKTDNVTAR